MKTDSEGAPTTSEAGASTATPPRTAHAVRQPDRSGVLARLVDGQRFSAAIAAVIVVNAIVLGLETYPEVMAEHGSILIRLNEIFYAVFLGELILRFASYGRHPADFFRSGWNVFDLVVIGGVLIPGVREQAQLLRLLRLARVARLVRFLPDVRVLVGTVIKSIPSLFSMVVLIFLLMFVYGMVGWSVFGEALPETWGTIGRSMLTLFVLLTLENFPTYLEEGETVTAFAVPFLVSYVLLAAFLVFNLLIGIVINSMEKARKQELEEAQATDRQDGSGAATPPVEDLVTQIAELRMALDAVEAELVKPARAAGESTKPR